MKKLYLDIHQHLDRATAEAVTGACAQDLETQATYGVKRRKIVYFFTLKPNDNSRNA